MDLWQTAQSFWGHASRAAARASLAWMASSAECKGAILASLHYTTSVCGGQEPPVQHTPGFGPLALAWGWGLLGVLVGFVLALHFPLIMSIVERPVRWYRSLGSSAAPPAPGLAVMQPWHRTAQAELQTAPGGPRRIILQRLVDEGDAALELLAAMGGVSKRDALARVLGDAVVRTNALAWGL